MPLKKASTIVDPLYDYDPRTDCILPPLSNSMNLTIMAVDNLPCELPRSASEEFGRDLIDRILRPLLVEDTEGIIAHATMAEAGKLTSRFSYLQDYADQSESDLN